jgi:hypothetical protein
MEIRPRGLQKTDYVTVIGASFIDWVDILRKEGVFTSEQATRILAPVDKCMEEHEGNLTLLDVRVLLGYGNSNKEWSPELQKQWEDWIQRFADDVNEPYYTSFFVIA